MASPCQKCGVWVLYLGANRQCANCGPSPGFPPGSHKKPPPKRRCKNCGRPAFRRYPTCCKKCNGTGRHNGDCWHKNCGPPPGVVMRPPMVHPVHAVPHMVQAVPHMGHHVHPVPHVVHVIPHMGHPVRHIVHAVPHMGHPVFHMMP